MVDMDILNGVRSEISFEAKLKGLSKAYQRTVKASTNQFTEFCNKECDGRTISETFDYIKKLPEENRESILYHVFQTWINQLSETKDPTTVRNYFIVIKKLARHHSIKISNEDVKDNLTLPKKIRERKYVLTLDDIHLILKESTWKKQGFYLFLLSTGMRPQEALSIRKHHIKLLDNGMYMIIIPAEATKLKVEREAFVSREVYPYLAKILRDLNQNDLIWTEQKNADHAVISAGSAFRNCCNRIGLTQRYENVNRRKLNLYCFRGFFYAKASRKHGDEYAHKAIGHTGYLPQYDRKTLDEKISMYKEFENELITDQTQRQKIELKEKEQKIIELEEKTKMITDLEHIIKKKDAEVDKKIDDKIHQFSEEFIKRIKTQQDVENKKRKDAEKKALSRIKELSSKYEL